MFISALVFQNHILQQIENWLRRLRDWVAAILFWSAFHDVVYCVCAHSLFANGLNVWYMHLVCILNIIFHSSPLSL